MIQKLKNYLYFITHKKEYENIINDLQTKLNEAHLILELYFKNGK